jgi:cytochrome c oxidase cbb3-type subunit III
MRTKQYAGRAAVLLCMAVAGYLQGQNQTAPAQGGGAQQQPTPAVGGPSPVTPQATPRRAGGGGGRVYPTYDAEAVERGQKVFQSNCAFCHGSNAKGGESGPDLLRSVVVLDDDEGEKIGVVILNGRLEKGMPKFPFSHEQIADVATFLHQRVKDAALRGTYQVLNVVSGNPEAGKAYFNGAGQCSSCHSVTGDLAHIGSKYDPATVQSTFVMPRAARRGPPGTAVRGEEQHPITVTVTPANGPAVEGVLEKVDDFNVALTDKNGEYHSFVRKGAEPKVQIHDPLAAHTELLGKYTDADIHNLTAYLVTLK